MRSGRLQPLGTPSRVRSKSLYRARATKDRKTSLVASCTWKCESLGQASLSGARRDTAIRISSVTMVLETHFSGILSLILFTRPMPRPRPRFILNNIPAFRQVCTAVDFSYSALRHALGPRDVRNLYRARATKDRKTSLVASCTWKQTVVFTYSTGLKKKVSIIKWLQFIHKRAPAELLFTGKEIFFPSFCEIIDHVSERILT